MKSSQLTGIIDCKGFTLVEILIALTLFSVILVFIFSGLHISNKSRLASESQIEENENQRLIVSFIKRQLSQIVPLIKQDGKENSLVFRGEPDAILFVAALPAHRGGGGLHLQRLQVEEDLILDYQVVTTDIELTIEEADERVKSQVLLSNIDRIQFTYYGREKVDDLPAWYDRWENRKVLPELISLLIISSDESSYWPEIVIPVHAQVSSGLAQFTLKTGSSPSRI